MKLQEMFNAINRRVDDVALTIDAVDWLNEAKDIMGIAVGAKFPDLVETNLADTFPFDDKYHKIPILFASARFKEKDSALQEAGNFMRQFEEFKREFVENYEVPPRYRDDRQSQQFTATEQQDTFTITKTGYAASSGELKVYVNDRLAEVLTINLQDNSFTLMDNCAAGDAVTASWEEHPDLQEPPYPWWTRW